MATNPNISEYLGILPKSDFDLAIIVENGLPTENINLLRDKGLSFAEVDGPMTVRDRRLQQFAFGEVANQAEVRGQEVESRQLAQR
jgi:hypothetical protein